MERLVVKKEFRQQTQILTVLPLHVPIHLEERESNETPKQNNTQINQTKSNKQNKQFIKVIMTAADSTSELNPTAGDKHQFIIYSKLMTTATQTAAVCDHLSILSDLTTSCCRHSSASLLLLTTLLLSCPSCYPLSLPSAL